MVKVRGFELRYADKMNDGSSVRFVTELNGKYSEIVVQNGNIKKAAAGQSHTYYRTCNQKPDDAILYMGECPECLAELLICLSPASLYYDFTKNVVLQQARKMQATLAKINEIVSKS